MPERKQKAPDELIAAASKSIGVPAEVLRSFAEREKIDPLKFLREKDALMAWKKRHSRVRIPVSPGVVVQVKEGGEAE